VAFAKIRPDSLSGSDAAAAAVADAAHEQQDQEDE
jgi:hypothetical protein